MRVFRTYAQLQAALDKPDGSRSAFRFLPKYAPAGFVCATCKATKPFPMEGGGTGYGVERDAKGRESMHCYACCSDKERARLIADGKGYLYLSGLPCFGMKADGKGLRLTDWPGGLVLPVAEHWTGRHNIARVVHFVRFKGPDGKQWAGRMTGENTQVCSVRRLKA